MQITVITRGTLSQYCFVVGIVRRTGEWNLTELTAQWMLLYLSGLKGLKDFKWWLLSRACQERTAIIRLRQILPPITFHVSATDSFIPHKETSKNMTLRSLPLSNYCLKSWRRRYSPQMRALIPLIGLKSTSLLPSYLWEHRYLPRDCLGN